MNFPDPLGLAARATSIVNSLGSSPLSTLSRLPNPGELAQRVIAEVQSGAGTADQLFNQVKGQLSPLQQGDLLRQLEQIPGVRELERRILDATPLDEIIGAGLNLVAAGKGTIDWLKQQGAKIKDALTSLPSNAANALADSMRGPSARQLTPGEVTAVREAFGNSIDLSNVRIVDGPGYNPDALAAFKIGGNPAITEGNTVYIEHKGFSADFSTSAKGRETLIHEFAHVRQYQKMGFGNFFAKYAGDLASVGGDRGGAYDYRSRPETTYRTETIEGQAQMVGDYARYRAGDSSETTDAQARDIENRLRGTGIYGL